MTASVIRTIAGHELRTALRGRAVPVFAVLFALLCVGVTLAGLGASGRVLVQGFTRTTLSLLVLAVNVLPLLGMIMGASLFGVEDGGTELLLAQPVGRAEVLIGRLAGAGAALAAVSLTGFSAAGILISVRTSTSGLVAYAIIAGATTIAGFIGLGIGALIGVLARRRGSAAGWAVATWFTVAILYDLAAIGILQLAGDGRPGTWLTALLALNPIDGIRTLGLLRLGADVLLGPTGAALQREMGPGGGAAWVTASLIVWLLLPVFGAAAVYRRRDF